VGCCRGKEREEEEHERRKMMDKTLPCGSHRQDETALVKTDGSGS
jgi:hypothetical protein